MLNITMVKRGVGTVYFTQKNSGEMVDITTVEGITFSVMPDDANDIYGEYIEKGFTVKPQKEPKVASPKTPKAEKPKMTREESLTEKYGDKETRKLYVEAKKHFTKAVVATLTKWQKDHRRLSLKEYADQREKGIKKMLADWEAAGRPAYNC